jgi:ABC-type proline/glycine betaine transport system permease subunit
MKIIHPKELIKEEESWLAKILDKIGDYLALKFAASLFGLAFSITVGIMAFYGANGPYYYTMALMNALGFILTFAILRQTMKADIKRDAANEANYQNMKHLMAGIDIIKEKMEIK